MPFTLMCVYAHPDDECFSAGGSLARYAAEGHRTVLVTTTGGEAGEISLAELATAENLAEVRAAELAEAAGHLRIGKLLSLGYRDSGMAGTDENRDPRSLHMADLDEAAGRLVEMLRAERPDVLITHDEQGDYGHPDHVKTHRVVLAAFDAVAGEPWAPRKLYVGAFSQSAMERMVEVMREAGIEAPFADRELKDVEGNPIELGTPDGLITTEVDTAAQTPLKRAALLAHRTQFGPEHFMIKLPAEKLNSMWPSETFRLLRGPRGEAEGRERDLFAGLDDER
jgi:N-acetyl-1-D-myo-inositol-2-amino-2-deoxy-alpha-D-glucopyranoside deacetylase